MLQELQTIRTQIETIEANVNNATEAKLPIIITDTERDLLQNLNQRLNAIHLRCIRPANEKN